MADLFDELLEDLSVELSITDPEYNEQLLKSKIKNAVRDVKSARNYPDYYSTEQIDADVYKYYSIIRDIVIYDYNKIGAEGEASNSSNEVSRTYVSRNSLFKGVIPISRT